MFIIVVNIEGHNSMYWGPYETYQEAEAFLDKTKDLFTALCPEFLKLVKFEIHSLLR